MTVDNSRSCTILADVETYAHLWTDANLPTPHLASYTRLSKDPLGILPSVLVQREDNAELAGREWPDLPIVLYEDRDKSAWTGEKRPAYDAMLERIQAGTVAAVVAYNQDRLLRLPRVLEDLIDLCDEARFYALATATGDLDLMSDDGQFKARIIAAVTKKSSDDTSRRVKRALSAKRVRGEWVGRLPYGVVSYSDGQVAEVDRVRVQIVEAMRDKVLAGDSFAATVRWAQAADPDGCLSRPGYREMLVHTPLLSAQDRADLKAVFRDPARRTAWSNERVSWLTGLLVCDVCDAKLRHDRTADRGRGQWKCPSYHVGIQLTRTEDAVRDMLLAVARVRKPVTVAQEPAAVPAPGAAERLARLARLYVAGSLTDAEWEAARAALVPAVEPPPAIAPSPVDAGAEWGDWTPVQRHRFAVDLLREVRVRRAGSRGRGSDVVSRLKPDWRQ